MGRLGKELRNSVVGDSMGCRGDHVSKVPRASHTAVGRRGDAGFKCVFLVSPCLFVILFDVNTEQQKTICFSVFLPLHNKTAVNSIMCNNYCIYVFLHKMIIIQ